MTAKVQVRVPRQCTAAGLGPEGREAWVTEFEVRMRKERFREVSVAFGARAGLAKLGMPVPKLGTGRTGPLPRR